MVTTIIAVLFTLNVGPIGFVEMAGVFNYKDETYMTAAMAAIAGLLWRSLDCLAFGNFMLGLSVLCLVNAIVTTRARCRRQKAAGTA